MSFDAPAFVRDLGATLPRNDHPAYAVPVPRPELPVPSPTASKRVRSSPPRLNLPDSQSAKHADTSASGPVWFVQPASPAMSTASPTSSSPPKHQPLGGLPANHASAAIPSTSTSTSSPPRTSRPVLPLAPSSPGGGLAARRAAKLGKKKLSLVVPKSNHIAATNSLLSPTTPSRLTHEGATALTDEPDEDALLEAETRSLPPSPISLVTFIGTEGAEAPDRTIGRLMLKQQADEMREQMRGGRGMKRRTSIPRLSLASTGPALQSTANLPAMSVSGSMHSNNRGSSGAPSAVQFLRRDTSESTASEGADGDEVEEFPYARGPREILPGIFLGSEENAKDPRILKEWKFGFVLNVAKEVECPWTEEVIEPEPPKEHSQTTPPVSPPRKPRHRRTKTHAAVDRRNPATATAESRSSTSNESRSTRPPFIRPTASTPNLQSVFRAASSATAPPPVPTISNVHLSTSPAAVAEDMLRSMSSSPPSGFHLPPRRSPPRARAHALGSKTTSPAPPRVATQSTCRSKGVVRFPQNRRTGRPSLEYLWLKWGHDEADLVEAHKFQSAFDFLDEARSRNERVLVHCQCGVSRSATVVIAFCMREAAKALEEGRDAKELSGCTGMHDTYSFVKEKSEWVGPNLGLVFQLVAYERTLRGDANDGGEDDEPDYPHYPPEPVSLPNDHETQAPLPAWPHTPNSLDNPSGRSEFSTPDLNQPLSPTFSSGTQQSSVTSTPISVHAATVATHPRIAQAGDQDEGDLGVTLRERHGSADTLKGEPAVFVLSPPPLPHLIVDRDLRTDLVSPITANYPSPALSPLEMPSKDRTNRRNLPPISLNGSAFQQEQPVVQSPGATKTSTRPPLTLQPLTTTGLSSLSLPRPPADITSPHSAITLSSDSSGSSTILSASAIAAAPSTTTGKKFGAQSKSERRASHRRVFSETIQVPTPVINPSWSSHSLHSGGDE